MKTFMDIDELNDVQKGVLFCRGDDKPKTMISLIRVNEIGNEKSNFKFEYLVVNCVRRNLVIRFYYIMPPLSLNFGVIVPRFCQWRLGCDLYPNMEVRD